MFQRRAKSAQIRTELRAILKPLPSLQNRINRGGISIQNKDEVLRTLKKMMEAVCDGVNLPCFEHARLLDTLTFFYYHIGPSSKMQYLTADYELDLTRSYPQQLDDEA